MRYYQTLYGIYTDDYHIHWNNDTWNHILVDEYLDHETSVTTSTCLTSYVSFIYPYPVEREFAIEGIIRGHVKIYNSNENQDFIVPQINDITLSKLQIKPYKKEGAAVPFAMHYPDAVSYCSAEGYVTIPFVMPVWNRVQVREYERIVLEIDCTSASAGWFLAHDNDSQYQEVKIIIPMI